MVEAYLGHTMLVGSLVEDALRSGRAPGPTLAATRREVHVALQAVVDVATGRWAKLMAARSDVHRYVRGRHVLADTSVCMRGRGGSGRTGSGRWEGDEAVPSPLKTYFNWSIENLY